MSYRTGGKLGFHVLYAALLLVLSPQCWAQDDEQRWSITPLVGINSPKLEQINDGIFRSPVLWSGNIVFQPEGETRAVAVRIPNQLPEIDYGTEIGFELAYDFNSRHTFVLGFSSWEGSSSSTTETVLPFQGIFSQVFFDREGRFSFNQFYTGYRHNVFAAKGKLRLHTQLSLHEFFDIDYREDMVFTFQTGPAESFKRIVQVEPQATGVAALRLGFGGEYFIADWFSIGVQTGYTYGFDDFTLNNIGIKSDFQEDDGVGAIRLPIRRGPNGDAQYLRSDGSGFEDLDLRIDGWNLLLRVSFYQ